ncbi:p24 [Malacosoma neustria nucleopolyhedrovirus]|uniref:p24 n=1 Tax=Malacosoma neustria nuclear polyhedrosis virus TaxID=38012 RepID=UPI000E35A56F|nr:p24 [Malacosoma neustria nucleopolyhedrovirus]AUF81649.1 p24 [Malacosoma neustria nucleopolyhedrovirus]
MSTSASNEIAPSMSFHQQPHQQSNTQTAHQPTQFLYDNESIEVVIIENNENDRDGYVECSIAARLLAPIVTIRGFNKSVLWTNVHSSQKLMRNNKNYVHVFSLCRYMGMYSLSTSSHPHEYYILKQLICDLIIGAQSQMIDPLLDIKKQICTLQDCITGTTQAGSGGENAAGNITIYHPTTMSTSAATANVYDYENVREMIRTELSIFLSSVGNIMENVKNMQMELLNKLAFSNDTMLDSFKSIKDLIIRKK